MNTRKVLIGAMVVVIGLPVVLVLIAWGSFYGLLSLYAPNRTNGAIVSSGERREYLLHVPKSYDRAKPTPLVISMHAAMNWPAFQMKVSQWNEAADKNGFIVVYPEGSDPLHLGPKAWFMDGSRSPLIAFHGTADPYVPYNGAPPGWLNPAPFPSVTTWTANWARRNRCAPSPVDSAVAADVTRREYTNCAENAAVVLYTIQGGGHQWPGGKSIPEWIVGPTTRSIDATSEMWAFFRKHPLPRK